MSTFEPFDDEYRFDKGVLTEAFPDYMYPSIQDWIISLLDRASLLSWSQGIQYVDRSKLVLPLNENMRKTFRNDLASFLSDISENANVLRNVISYLLQNVANKKEGENLEIILARTSSAYAVDFRDEEATTSSGAISWVSTKIKLVYRVTPIVKRQAENTLAQSELLAEAWDSYYGLKPDDEKVITRCTDAIAGLLRDRFFPGEKRTQLGTLLQKVISEPEKYPVVGETLFDKKEFLATMKGFSAVRGNHKTGTGRAPTHAEAGFVLHFSIMLFQVLGMSEDD